MKLLTIVFALIATLVPLSAQSLRLASYNIRHGRNIEGTMNLEKTAALLATLKADVIALQEVDNTCTRSGRVNQAKFIGEKLQMNHAFGKSMDFQGGQYGLAIISKYPILEVKNHKLPMAAGAEPRIALEIVVELSKGKKASFVSIHFDYTSEEHRQPQIKTLLKALETTKHPVALAGDFNALPTSDSIALFKENWYNTPKKGPNFTCPADKPTKEIDYFMLRGFQTPAQCTVIEEKVISDHRPIVTDVKVK